MPGPLANVRYTVLGARGLAWPVAIFTGALAALPFVSGLPLPTISRAPEPPPSASPSVRRLAQEVYVANVMRGCRWQPSSDPAVQIADCGDESEAVRVVFRDGQITEYRLTARQDPSRIAPTGQVTATNSVAAQQPSQPGRLVPSTTNIPIRVTPRAGS